MFAVDYLDRPGRPSWPTLHFGRGGMYELWGGEPCRVWRFVEKLRENMEETEMQETAIRTRGGSPAVRQGLLFGVIVGVVQAIIGLISTAVNLGTGGIIFTIVSIVVALVGYFLAGMRASQQTGKVPTGLVAGLLTGLVGSIISFAVTLIITLVMIDSIRATAQKAIDQQHVNIHYTNGLIITGVLITGVLVIGVAVVFGLAVGSIGGVVGKSRANIPVESYQESMFQPPSAPPMA